VAEAKCLESPPAAAQVIASIGASTTQIANGLIRVLRHIDAGEFSAAQEPSDGAGIALVGFEGPWLLGNEREGGQRAGDFELLEAPGNAKAARCALG
jgi:hypothetical protein